MRRRICREPALLSCLPSKRPENHYGPLSRHVSWSNVVNVRSVASTRHMKDLYNPTPGKFVVCDICEETVVARQGKGGLQPATIAELNAAAPLSIRVTYVCHECRPVYKDRLFSSLGRITPELKAHLGRRLNQDRLL
eukprot:544202-Pyramimonas_sp.AAC.1